jgi:hypothetical protein
MFNQLRRIWADNGSGDKDFTPQEQKLKDALLHLQQAADSLSRASESLLTVINSKGSAE